MPSKVNVSTVRRVNLATTLKIIREQGPISRADIAKLTKLSPTTVSAVVNQLIEEKLVAPLGEGVSSGGRRPILIRFCPESRLAVGVEVTTRDIRVGLADLNGAILKQITLPTILTSEEDFLGQIKAGIDEILAFSQKKRGSVIGIGITVPGLIAKDRCSLVYSASLGLENVPVIDALQAYDYPILLENDMNAAALGERAMGAGMGLNDLIYVSISHGIGAGIIINNKIYTGHNGRAGEFGHMTLDLHGPLCECGSRGCLGPMASGPAVQSKIAHFLSLNIKTKLHDLMKNRAPEAPYELLKEAVAENDEVALAILEECAEYLGVAIANLITFWDPPLVILGGTFMETFGNQALDLIKKSATKRVIPNYIDPPLPIVASKLGPDIGILGAVTLVFSHFLSPTHISGTSSLALSFD